MSDRFGPFSTYYPARHTYYSGHQRGGPDVGQAETLPAGWDPFEVLRRYQAAAAEDDAKRGAA